MIPRYSRERNFRRVINERGVQVASTRGTCTETGSAIMSDMLCNWGSNRQAPAQSQDSLFLLSATHNMQDHVRWSRYDLLDRYV
jgi:hypothetical protein